MEWTNEAVMQFLEGYQAEPCLWDPQHPDHRNRNKITDTWQRLHENLKLTCTLNDLKKKKDSLMASFRMLLNKKKKSIKSGIGTDELFKPTWFAFEVMERFLAPVYHCSPTTNTENISTENEHPHSQDEREGIDNRDNDVNDNNNDKEADTAGNILSDVTTPNAPKPVVNSKNKNKKDASEKRMDEALDILKNAVQKRKETEKDECDLYGELLAKKLRRFNDDEREEIMLEIDSLLLTRKRKKSSVIPVPTPSPTFTNYTELNSPSSSLCQYTQPMNTQADNTENVQTFQNVSNYLENFDA